METKYFTKQYQQAYPSCKYLRIYAYGYIILQPLAFSQAGDLNYYFIRMNNLNNKKILNEYANWIDALIDEYSKEHQENDQKIDKKAFVEKHGYYITFSFDFQKMIRKYQLSPSSYNEVNERNINNVRFLYNLICKKLFGRNFMKKGIDSPLVIMCSDVNDTKFWSYKGDITNPHIHSIWMLNPDIIIDLKQSIFDILESDTSNNFDFRDVHIDRITSYDPSVNAPSEIATYTAKFIPFNTHELDISSDIRILPEYNSNIQ